MADTKQKRHCSVVSFGDCLNEAAGFRLAAMRRVAGCQMDRPFDLRPNKSLAEFHLEQP